MHCSLVWLSLCLFRCCNCIFATDGPSCCSKVQSKLGDKVSFPSSPTYQNEQNGTNNVGYFAAQEIEVKPSCRVTPTCTEDVSAAVRELSGNACIFAIRGGGHITWAGSANIQDGVTIDLSSMNQVSVAQDKKITSVGSGARWRDVYIKLDPMGLSVAGGRVDIVGVGGLTVGGGISYFGPRYGWTCDTVHNFEVVLASGDVVNANLHSNSDLFKALKGGSNNFGVVTRFDYETFQQGLLWGGLISYPYQNITKLLGYLQDFTYQTGEGVDDYASMELTYSFNASGPLVAGWIGAYTKPQPHPEILKNFTEFQPQLSSTLRNATLSNLTYEGGSGIPEAARALFATLTFANNATFLAEIIELAQSTFKFQPQGMANYYFVLEPLPRVFTSRGALKGGNSLGLDGKDDLILLDFNGIWTLAADDAVINAAVTKFLDKATTLAKSRGQYGDFIYLNYGFQGQEVIRSYGPQNVKALQQASRKYDPSQTFQKLVPGAFKIPVE